MATTSTRTTLDELPATGYLVMEVLAARARLGEPSWPFPRRLGPTLRSLTAKGLLDFQSDVMPGHYRVTLTGAGRAALFPPSSTYRSPLETDAFEGRRLASAVVGAFRSWQLAEQSIARLATWVEQEPNRQGVAS